MMMFKYNPECRILIITYRVMLPYSCIVWYSHKLKSNIASSFFFPPCLFWQTQNPFKWLGSPEQKQISGPNHVFYRFSFCNDASYRLPWKKMTSCQISVHNRIRYWGFLYTHESHKMIHRVYPGHTQCTIPELFLSASCCIYAHRWFFLWLELNMSLNLWKLK